MTCRLLSLEYYGCIWHKVVCITAAPSAGIDCSLRYEKQSIILQWQKIRIHKRNTTNVDLADLVEEIGNISCRWNEIEEMNQEMLPINCPHFNSLQPTFGYTSEVHRCRTLIALRHNSNLINWLTPLDIVSNSSRCIQNDHDSCEGIIKAVIDGSDSTKMCACQCHNSSYQLVKRMFGVVNQKD